MAIKPLKLKRYISEEEAAQLLSLLIGEKVSSEEMAEFALEGVIPAYMQFSPTDEKTYPEGMFSFSDDKTDLANIHPLINVIPYPLPDDGWIEDSRGARWQVFAERAGGSGDAITPDHYVRIYAPQEVCQVAEIMNDPTAYPEWPAIHHSHGGSWIYSDSYDSDGEELLEYTRETVHILSPFKMFNNYMHTTNGRKKLVTTGPTDGTGRRIEWPLVVAGLWELLRDEWKKQGAVAVEIAKREWKGARKDDVNHALRLAKQAMEAQNR